MDRKRSKSREGRGRERGGRRAVSGGERAQLMMKQGRVGVRVHYAFSSLARRDVRVNEAGWGGSFWGRRVKGGGGGTVHFSSGGESQQTLTND